MFCSNTVTDKTLKGFCQVVYSKTSVRVVELYENLLCLVNRAYLVLDYYSSRISIRRARATSEEGLRVCSVEPTGVRATTTKSPHSLLTRRLSQVLVSENRLVRSVDSG